MSGKGKMEQEELEEKETEYLSRVVPEPGRVRAACRKTTKG